MISFFRSAHGDHWGRGEIRFDATTLMGGGRKRGELRSCLKIEIDWRWRSNNASLPVTKSPAGLRTRPAGRRRSPFSRQVLKHP